MVIIVLLTGLLIIIGVGIVEDGYRRGGYTVVVIGIILMGVSIGIEHYVISERTPNYKQGQIDALTGEVQYELVTQPDSSRAWQLKEDNND